MTFFTIRKLSKTLTIALALVLVASSQVFAVTVEDSLGQHEFSQPATRVIALNWGVTEEVLELGVTPIGVADIKGYKTWVTRPEIPDGVIDVGTRAEPNVERLAELKPDLIIVGSMQQDMVAKLSPIAPVLYFDNYRADHSNIQAIEHSFIELGKALDKAEQARARLEARNQALAELKRKIWQHFNGQPPKVGVARFGDANHARLYGDNSMPMAALNALGIEAAFDIPSTTWGQVQKPIRDLAYLDGVLLYIRPLANEDELFKRPLFRMMPFVLEGRIAPVKSTWTYGGALSIRYLAEHFVDALTSMPRDIQSAKSGGDEK